VKKLSRKVSVWLWILATFITILTAVYQRLTGPTHPVRGKITVGTTTVRYRLLRSHETASDAVMTLSVPDQRVTGILRWKRYKSADEWTATTVPRAGDNLLFIIPRQSAAGKVIYEAGLQDADGKITRLTQEPVIVRFRGEVPFWALHPHILLMFFSMLIGTRCGLEALARGANARRLAIESAAMLLAGGLILGPIVQYYAFGTFWSGWPFGHDLTDNKTALAMLFWLVALWRDGKKGSGRGWYIAAAIAQLVVYSIPHSILGSELDYSKLPRS
jgi:hypothetical protein